MGNTFTAQTGYQPGDPSAWRAATDYALDAAQKNGWGAWYGARNVGVTGRQGIGNDPRDRSVSRPRAVGRRPPGPVLPVHPLKRRYGARHGRFRGAVGRRPPAGRRAGYGDHSAS